MVLTERREQTYLFEAFDQGALVSLCPKIELIRFETSLFDHVTLQNTIHSKVCFITSPSTFARVKALKYSTSRGLRQKKVSVNHKQENLFSCEK